METVLGGSPQESMDHVARILGRLVHDLNNPLAVVSSNLAFLEEQLRDPELSDAAEEASAAVLNLKALFDMVAAVAPLRSEQKSFQIASIDLASVQRRIDKQVAHRLGSRSLKWMMDRDRVVSDEQMLCMIVYGIVDHSVKRCPPGGSITVEVQSGVEQWTLRVCDSGLPFAPDFEPSFVALDICPQPEVDASRYRNDGGLGLYVAGVAARALGGKTSVRNRSRVQQEGVMFEVFFPNAPANAEADVQNA